MAGAMETWSRLAPRAEALAPGQKWHVFLSYRSVNRAWVINLYDVLRAHGHQVFLDQCAIAAGDELTEQLETALVESQAGVLVWSSATADSRWVRREYAVMERRAERGRFQFVPARLDSAPLPVFAESRVFVDFSQYPDGPNGGELLRLLHAVVGTPLSPDAARFAVDQDEEARRAAARIKAAVRLGDAEELRRLFATGGLAWETSAALGCAVAEGLTKLKEDEAALEVLSVVGERFPRAIRPKQLRALALARRGANGDLEQAQRILSELYELGEKDPETVGILARTWMDRYQRSGEARYLRHSRDLYAEAFANAADDYYTGINAAAKSIFLGTPQDVVRARDLAAKVQQLVGTETVPRDYWKTATVGEVELILGNYAAAAKRYEDAVAMAPNERGSHESTWRQASRLMEALRPDEANRALIAGAFAHLTPTGSAA